MPRTFGQGTEDVELGSCQLHLSILDPDSAAGRVDRQVLAVGTGDQALAVARSRLPVLIILDLLLPGLQGLDICRILKADQKTHAIPIIILSAKSEESDIVTGLELGADDYITKPFSSKVLAARLRRILRQGREQNLDRSVIRIHNLVIDPGRCEALLDDRPLALTLSEFNLLYVLARRPGIVLSRYQIVDSLHGGDYVVTDRAIDVQITYLRKKLGPCRDYIETVRGVGYRFKDSRQVPRQGQCGPEVSVKR
ncbi:MAG: response regulator transcription factor [Planctomycetes bacterium]|nr:response regulator transcription factor [Planctomycetota bacterium]